MIEKKPKIVITAIICLTILQGIAMYFGINHTFRTYTVGGIAGLAGWSIPFKTEVKK